MSARFFNDIFQNNFDPFSSFFHQPQPQRRRFRRTGHFPPKQKQQNQYQEDIQQSNKFQRKKIINPNLSREEQEIDFQMQDLQYNIKNKQKEQETLKILEELKILLENQGYIKAFAKLEGIKNFLEILLLKTVKNDIKIQIMIILNDIVQNNHFVQKQFLKYNYWQILNIWYENNWNLRLKMLSLMSGILGGNFLPIKRDFLENQNFNIFISFLNEIIRNQNDQIKIQKYKIVAKILQIINNFLSYEDYLDLNNEILNLEDNEEDQERNTIYKKFTEFSIEHKDNIIFLLEKIAEQQFQSFDLKEQNNRIVLLRTIDIIQQKYDLSKELEEQLEQYQISLDELIQEDEYYLNEKEFLDRIYDSN